MSRLLMKNMCSLFKLQCNSMQRSIPYLHMIPRFTSNPGYHTPGDLLYRRFYFQPIILPPAGKFWVISEPLTVIFTSMPNMNLHFLTHSYLNANVLRHCAELAKNVFAHHTYALCYINSLKVCAIDFNVLLVDSLRVGHTYRGHWWTRSVPSSLSLIAHYWGKYPKHHCLDWLLWPLNESLSCCLTST